MGAEERLMGTTLKAVEMAGEDVYSPGDGNPVSLSAA